MNDPQTAVWGICGCLEYAVCRKDLNEPLTAVSGILLFVQGFFQGVDKLHDVV